MNASDAPKRRLAAILFLDVVGYSRLMHEDEAGTRAAFRAHRREVIDPAIAVHGGRLVKSIGDGLLIEFASVTEAVGCAVDIQHAMARRNAGVPEDQAIVFRAGVNFGDVIVEDDDVHGDGVNIAARLEGLAPPGGLCVSGTVHAEVQGRLPVRWQYTGRQTVKNIDQPVPVYRAVLDEPGQIPRATVPRSVRKRRARWLVVAASAALALAVAAALVVTEPWRIETRPIDGASTSVPERPSIAVLPFANLSGDTSQDYFSDGITEAVITDLSRFSDLLVVARNSTLSYKGRLVGAQEVGRELGVRYVLEGSVQRTADRIRITARLSNAANAQQLWAERYDRKLEDLFALQDEITVAIVTALAVRVSSAERQRAMAKHADNLDAYDIVLRGRELLARRTAAANRAARKNFEAALALVPGYAAAELGLGHAWLDAALYGWTEFAAEALDRAQQHARAVLRDLPDNAAGHALLGRVHVVRREYDAAFAEIGRALELNPNDADSHAAYGTALLWASRPGDAVGPLERALRADPRADMATFVMLGLAYFLVERAEDAIAVLRRGLERDHESVVGHAVLAAAAATLGRNDEAARAVAMVRRLDPFFSTEAFASLVHDSDQRAALVAALARAGLK